LVRKILLTLQLLEYFYDFITDTIMCYLSATIETETWLSSTIGKPCSLLLFQSRRSVHSVTLSDIKFPQDKSKKPIIKGLEGMKRNTAEFTRNSFKRFVDHLDKNDIPISRKERRRKYTYGQITGGIKKLKGIVIIHCKLCNHRISI
jgi:hypothetical protein